MAKKLLILTLAFLMLCPFGLVHAAASLPSVTLYQSDDFEGYTYPEGADGTIIENTTKAANATATGNVKNAEGKSIDTIWGFLSSTSNGRIGLETVSRGENATTAICITQLGSITTNNLRFSVPNDVAKKIYTDGYRYAVLKMDIKNGTSSADILPALRFFRSSSIDFAATSIAELPVKQYDWNEYVLIMDSDATDGKKIYVAVNGVLSETAIVPTDYFTNFAGLVHSCVSAYNYSSASGLKAWIDNVELYGASDISTVLESSSPANGVLNAARGNEITLKFKGPEAVSEISSSTVTVTKTNDDVTNSPVSVTDVTYNKEESTVKITLAEKTDEATYYTVNIPAIKNIFSCETAASSVTFRTTGPVKLDLNAEFKKEATGAAVTALDSGVICVKAEITNSDVVQMQSGVIVCELKKDGKTEGISFEEVGVLEVGEKHSASFAFTVPDDSFEIAVYAKDSLNGAYTFSNVITLSKSGIVSGKVSNLEVAPPTLDDATLDADSVKFYSLALGENGAREEVSEIKSGLIECVANVTLESGDCPFIIATLKKDGVLIKTAYLTKTGADGENKYNVALYVPEDEGYSIDVFAWTDFNGSGSYFGKTTLE